MSARDLFFYALAGLALVSAAGVAFSKNVLHATLALLGTFLGVAGLYVQLSADLLAAIQVLVYVGGTLTLILFAVMLTSRMRDAAHSNLSTGALPAMCVVGLLLWSIGRGIGAMKMREIDPRATVSTARIGHAFLGEYLLPFELVSVLLLFAMVGAVMIARRAVKSTRGPDAGRTATVGPR